MRQPTERKSRVFVGMNGRFRNRWPAQRSVADRLPIPESVAGSAIDGRLRDHYGWCKQRRKSGSARRKRGIKGGGRRNSMGKLPHFVAVPRARCHSPAALIRRGSYHGADNCTHSVDDSCRNKNRPPKRSSKSLLQPSTPRQPRPQAPRQPVHRPYLFHRCHRKVRHLHR